MSEVAAAKDLLSKIQFEAIDSSYILAKQIGIDLAATIKKRVLESGLNSNRTLFSPYSDNYKKYLTKKNRDTKSGLKFVKNFELTGQMWANFGTSESVIVEKNGNIIKVTLKGGNSDSKNKIDWNSSREKKSIIEPTEEELKQAREDFNNELIKILFNVR